MKSVLLLVIAAIVTCHSSISLCSYPPIIELIFEGWSSDGNRCAFRMTVIDSETDAVKEDALYVVNLSATGMEVEKKPDYDARIVEELELRKAASVKSSEAGSIDRTFIIRPNVYIYVDYDTVMEGIDNGLPSYTLHRRIWILNEGDARIVFKEDESVVGKSKRSEDALEAYLSPGSKKLFVVFDVTSHFRNKGFVILDLKRLQLVESKIYELDWSTP